jgi:uncharacterized membrane protein
MVTGMLASGLHYFPVTLPFLLVLTGLLALVVGMAALRVLHYASISMGIGVGNLLAILSLSLLGSYINIPVAYLPERQSAAAAEISYFGVTYVIPVVRDFAATVLAVNVGGALIPVALSLYLIVKHQLFGLSVIGVAIVAAVCHLLARPVPGLGIAEPILVPALTTAAVALVLAGRRAGPLAYISGSLGTLIGADVLNLNKIQGLGAPIASIGGAGTFDGIFIIGLLAVLYAGLAGEARASDRQ